MNEGVTQETLTSGSEATVDQAAPSTSPSEDVIRVLYADDEESLRKIVTMYLEIIDTSLVIESVSSAADALKALEKHDYDCIISDYQMPGMNGIDFAQIVKRKHDVPFIIYTGRGSEEVAVVAFSVGVDDYVRKEVDPSHYHVLARRIETVVQRKRSEFARRQAETALKESEKMYRKLVDLAPDGIITLDFRGFIRSSNSAFIELTGFSEDEIVGKHFSELDTIHYGQIPTFAKMFGTILMGRNSEPFEFQFHRKDGAERWGEAHATIAEIEESKKVMLAITRDITDRKREHDKLDVTGRITRHDIRNKLTIIAANLDLSKRKLKSNKDINDNLADMHDACDNIIKILDFAANYEKLGIEAKRPINVSLIFESALNMFETKDITVENDCQGLTVQADSMLKSVFYNLIDNTLRHGGEVSKIRFYAEEDGSRIIYEDDGIGLPADKRRNFNSHTDKTSINGLTLIKRIVESYGGSMKEEGQPGGGSRFVILLRN